MEETLQSAEGTMKRSEMTVFDVVKQLKLETFCDLMYGTARGFETQEEFMEALQKELTEKELQQINTAAQRDGLQPLSFSFRQ